MQWTSEMINSKASESGKAKEIGTATEGVKVKHEGSQSSQKELAVKQATKEDMEFVSLYPVYYSRVSS